MGKMMINRRNVLIQTFGWGAGLTAVIAASRQAQAFGLEQMSSTSGAGLAYANRCGGPSEHTSIIEALRSRLASDASATSETATCPVCGCPVSVTR